MALTEPTTDTTNKKADVSDVGDATRTVARDTLLGDNLTDPAGTASLRTAALGRASTVDGILDHPGNTFNITTPGEASAEIIKPLEHTGKTEQNGRKRSTIDADGTNLTLELSADGRRVEKKTVAQTDGTQIITNYDASGNARSETIKRNNVPDERRFPDGANRVAVTQRGGETSFDIFGLNGTTSLTYNADGRLSRRVDQTDNQTSVISFQTVGNREISIQENRRTSEPGGVVTDYERGTGHESTYRRRPDGSYTGTIKDQRIWDPNGGPLNALDPTGAFRTDTVVGNRDGSRKITTTFSNNPQLTIETAVDRNGQYLRHKIDASGRTFMDGGAMRDRT